MTHIAAAAELLPSSILQYLDGLDRTGDAYHFDVIDRDTYGVTLKLLVDGGSHNGTTVELRFDGTWRLHTFLPIGEKS